MPPASGARRAIAGRNLKTLFTKSAAARYDAAMILIAAAAIAASSAPVSPWRASGAVAQAQAMVRIVSGVRLHLGQESNEGAPSLRDTVVRTQGAAVQPARLIEFE
jgi:hypothetical protein